MVMGEDVGHYGGSYKVRALGEPAATDRPKADRGGLPADALAPGPAGNR